MESTNLWIIIAHMKAIDSLRFIPGRLTKPICASKVIFAHPAAKVNGPTSILLLLDIFPMPFTRILVFLTFHLKVDPAGVPIYRSLLAFSRRCVVVINAL